MPHRPKKKVQTQPVIFQPDSAGIDIGATELFVAVPPDRAEESVRCFSAFTADLHALADWLAACRIKSVAMESTGVYWIAVFQILETRGFEVCLVNARHVKNVPGRKSDVLDCQWLQYLHSVGLLCGSFRPPDQVYALRSYLRHRDMLVRSAARHVQHVQKALTQMNLHLHHVVSDLTGVTGLAILDAMLAGERDPQKLAALRDRRIKASETTIAKALVGDYRAEHLFALRQALALYRQYQSHVLECDREIERHLATFEAKTTAPTPAPAGRQRKKPERHQPQFDLRGHLHRILGLDLTALPGLSTLTVHTLFSEVGGDLAKFPTAKHFASWLGLCPDHRISGGKVLCARTRSVQSRAAYALRMAAYAAGHSYSALGDYFRRMRARLGAPKAITATAHKLARIIYHLLKTGCAYDDTVFARNELRYQQRHTARLRKQAHELGFSLVPLPAQGEGLPSSCCLRAPPAIAFPTRYSLLTTRYYRTMSATEKQSPMMQQYFEVRRALPRDTLLLFRLGDFFELFFDDAIVASRLLGLTLTKRLDHPMAGLPSHALDTYVNKLLAAGKKVAICDQAEPAKAGKLVRRQLMRILSPGTTLAASQLDAARNHYLCAVALDKSGLHAAWLDLSTAEFRIATDTHIANLLPVLTALDPAELLIVEGERERWAAAPHEQVEIHALHTFAATRLVTELSGYHYETGTGAKTVMDTLGVLNLQGFGLAHTHPALGPAGALVYYATENLCAKPENLRGLQEYRSAHTLLLDPATLRNLEIFSSARGGRDGSLLAAINRTVTSAGARLLERWLAAPTLDLAEINRRQTIIGELLGQTSRLASLRDTLTLIRDIPRILGRLQNRLRNPRELGGVRDTLAQLPALRADLAAISGPQLSTLHAQLHELPPLRELLASALADELPNDLADGNFIRAGYDARLDELRALTSGNRTWLSDLERSEQERTGIRSLKVRFTNNFGYYIEVTKANLHLVPSDYIRRQTTVGGERYVTESLRQKEKEIFHAEENALAREHELFAQLVAAVLDESVALAHTADALAELDVLAGWGVLAREWDYARPDLDDTDVLEIVDGRHPVVEQMLRSPEASPARGATAAFVPNDTLLGAADAQIALITGPNMAGKSTYIRQVALITLLAQIGCWVPAKSCRIGLVDRIFSRVGASDDLARGNSTFMVEMNETANILNNATDRSLIILDEIGRGTSTYDGLSIAWAVVEHLHRDATRGPRTLFATHYQELTQLEKHLPRLRNFSVAVKEWNDEIVFVRRVIPGAADRSYGIQVARLAGLPLSVIDRAKTILAKLESDDTTVTLPAPQAKPKKKLTVAPADDSQLSLL